MACAEEARTGIDEFGDWSRELVQTGYLHNHTRMWFASIWIFTLRLPWSPGAADTADRLTDDGRTNVHMIHALQADALLRHCDSNQVRTMTGGTRRLR